MMLAIFKSLRILIQGLFISIIISGTIISCGEKSEKTAPKQTTESHEFDYHGRISQFFSADSLTAVDSLRLVESAYYQASFNNQLYKFQNLLTQSYFFACNEKCETRKCFPGNIINAATAYYFDGNSDSAIYLCDLIAKKRNNIPPEVLELKNIIETACSTKKSDKLKQLYIAGEIKSPAAIGLLAVILMDKGEAPDFWLKDLRKKLKNTESMPLLYAYSYALALSGDIIEAWKETPNFASFDTIFPPPSFTENIILGDSVLTQKIYLPVDLYIRKQIDEMFLAYLLSSGYGSQSPANITALKALSYIKRLKGFESELDNFTKNKTDDLPATFTDELSYILTHEVDSGTPSDVLKVLKNPISRTAFLGILAGKPKSSQSQEITNLIFKEIDKIKIEINNMPDKVYWQSSIFLSRALFDLTGPTESFNQMNHFGRLDLSVRNNSPEWLALFASAGMAEGSQISIVTLVSYNLARYYPYAIGLYEIMQNYKLLCKYY